MSTDGQKKVVGKECRFVVYVPPPEYSKPDLHVVKEIVYYDDGTREPNLHTVYDFKRPGWVTKKGRRDHQQKKEWTSQDDLIRFESTQAKLVDKAAQALGKPWFRQDLRNLSQDPYLYGTDILSTAVLKKAYQTKYADIKPTMFSVAALDIETETVDPDTFGQTIMATLSMKEYCTTFVRDTVVKGIANLHERVERAMEKHLGHLVKERNLKCNLVVVDSEIELWKQIMAEAHRLKPDFLEIWNMDFEITKVLEACDRAGYDPKYLFSDPSIPEEYKFFKYKQGPNKKVSASGKVTPIKPAARWHTVFCPASFYVIDGMCCYKQVRTGQQEEQSYGLDPILKKHDLPAKFDLPEVADIRGLKWFQVMQTQYPIEYIIYNRYDCIGPEMLDEKIKDLCVSVPSLAATSDFQHIRSQPRRLVDELHWECLEANMVIGTTGETLVDEEDGNTLSREDWIVTLPAGIIVDSGLKIIAENPQHATAYYSHVGDLDVAASYPNGGASMNMSKATTSREIVDIKGVDEETFRAQNMGLTAGHVNAVEYCTEMFNFPTIEQVVMAYRAQQQQQQQSAHLSA